MKRNYAFFGPVVFFAFAFGAGAVVSIGCNAVLGNEEGTPANVSFEGGPSVTPLQAHPIGDGGNLEECDLTKGNKVCFGLCVKTNETNTGCGGTSCVACDPKNVGSVSCKGQADTFGCGYDKCNDGYDNCDGDGANGCETSLVSRQACGKCGKTCSGATPLCNRNADAGGYECVGSCSGETTECTGACVDTKNSVDHCGDCTTKCDRPGATATCVDSHCVFQCSPGTHACGNTCAPDVDTKACGPDCKVCPDAPDLHLVATCENLVCGTTCDKGWRDCDFDPTNGCEVQGVCPNPDPLPCGCGSSSGAATASRPAYYCVPINCTF